MESDHALPTVDELVERHLPTLYRFAYRLAGNREDAEDLVQETFLVAQRKISQLRDPSRALSWLFTVLRSCRSQQLKRQVRMPARSESVSVEELADPALAPIVTVDELDLERLPAVLEGMPEEYRQPLLLFYFEDFKYREIAEVLDCPIGTVMSRLSRAKAYLRGRLAAVHTGHDA